MLYFSHDADAATDIKCKKLVKRFGMEGYGRWWRLCELMAGIEGHALCVETPEDAEILADELHFEDMGECMLFLEQLSEIGLVRMPGNGTVYSESMNRRSLYFGKNRANGKKGGRPSEKPTVNRRLTQLKTDG